MIVSGIRCTNCKDEIWSRSRHDFRYCSCKRVAVDGGREYLKISGETGDWEVIKLEVPDPRPMTEKEKQQYMLDLVQALSEEDKT